jgi:hypothetical protein
MSALRAYCGDFRQIFRGLAPTATECQPYGLKQQNAGWDLSI